MLLVQSFRGLNADYLDGVQALRRKMVTLKIKADVTGSAFLTVVQMYCHFFTLTEAQR